MELLDEVEVLLDQGQGVPGSPSSVLFGHTAVTTELDSPKRLNIVFDFIEAVERLLGDLAGRFLFHQPLVANDRLVSDGTAEVMNGTPAWDGLLGFSLMLEDDR